MSTDSQKRLSRRELLKASALLLAGGVASACGATPTATPVPPTPVPPTPVPPPTATKAPAPAATTAPAAPAATATPAPPAATATPAPPALSEAETRLKKIGFLPGSPDHAKGFKTVIPQVASIPRTDQPLVVYGNKRVQIGDKVNLDDPKTGTWWNVTRELFNMDFRIKFTTNDQDDQTKWNLALASGDLPDFCEYIPFISYQQMLQANQLEDITDAWNSYADATWLKKPIDGYRDGKQGWTYAKQNGRIMAIPLAERAFNNYMFLWVRQDWLDKLNLKVPTTLDELHNVAQAFLKAQLGKGAAGTSIGLNLSMSLRGWFASMSAIFAQFGVMCGNVDQSAYWIDQGGTLVSSDILPGSKQALTLLRSWYADGTIPKDFYTIPDADAMNLRAGGNLAGLHFAPAWGARWPLEDSMKNDPSAKWTYAPVPVGPSGKRGNNGEFPYRLLWGFRKGFKYVKEVLAVENFWVSLYEDPAKRYHGWDQYDYRWLEGNKCEIPPSGFDKIGYPGFGADFARGGAYMDFAANGKQFSYWESWKKTPAAEWDAMQTYLLNDPLGTQTNNRLAYAYSVEDAPKTGVFNGFLGLPTPSIIAYQASLDKMRDQTYFGIITGQKPLDEFDTFVANWKKSGGDQITKEVNDWYAANKG